MAGQQKKKIKLSLQQRLLKQIVAEHLRRSEDERLRRQIRLHVSGPAGSGKSTLIKEIKALLDKKKETDETFHYIIASFTALSAKNIEGETLHSAFGLPLEPFKTLEEYKKYK